MLSQVWNELLILALYIFLALSISFLAYRRGFYRYPSSPIELNIGIVKVGGAFLLFWGTASVIVLLAVRLGFTLKEIGPQLGISLNMVILPLLLGYTALLRKDVLKGIFWGREAPSGRRMIRQLGFGALALIIAYPIVLAMSAAAKLVSEVIWGKSGIEQPALHQLKELVGKPLLFTLMGFTVVIVIPLIEELVFRGFLQTWLRRFLGRTGGIFAASILFALAHLIPSQGTGNLELILAIFGLSCFLGFLYERQQTLWAPIGLHALFNGVTTISVLFVG